MMAWHYTIEDRMRSILASGWVIPATAGVPLTEKPVVWFSRNPRWEPTASKIAIHRSGQVRLLTTQEMFSEIGDQLYRLGMDTDKLLPWAVLKRKAKISRKEQRRLLKKANEVGASPSDWLGFIGGIRLEDLTVEKWSPIAKRWITFEIFDEGGKE